MSLLSVDTALEILLEQAQSAGCLEVEELALVEAENRVLAQPLLAQFAMPPWPNSSMDGYAVRSAEVQAGQALPVSQKIFAGQNPEPLAAGSCARIFTGAPMPEGADAVEMQENTQELEDGRVRFVQAVPAAKFVRPKGQEALPGDEILPAGIRLGPIELAMAASLGCAVVRVRRQLRVAVASTGDELVEPGQPLAPGQIYNSNRTLLIQSLKRLNCAVIDLGILPDDAQQTRDRLAAMQDVDLLISSGGVSVGEADYLGQVIREEGELDFWKLALKPGKPFTLGRYQGVPVIGLPGNPTSSLVTFLLLARPYILTRMGVSDPSTQSFVVPVNFAMPVAGVRREFIRVALVEGRAEKIGNQCSGILRSATQSHGLLELPENTTCAVGDRLRFWPFSSLLN
ncbi:MAG: molybdopterin molybdotransferase MoeA [Thiopseudomonas sp.]|nr:molybdopterin molybdotransferase MoeA [Thiopseudomonas sp.]MCK9465641.1 molybdopterin molybdotransferase MoeA [Thiopseudomonas sp.]